MKVLCYGVRDVEKTIFEQVNERFNYEMTCVLHLLTLDNVDEVEGFDALLLGANCIGNHENLEVIKNKYGIDYVFTRTAGVNHIDLEAAKELGIRVGYVPMYSPNAIAELVELYPKALISPHIGSYTDEAVLNMVEYSFENLEDVMNGKETKRILV